MHNKCKKNGSWWPVSGEEELQQTSKWVFVSHGSNKIKSARLEEGKGQPYNWRQATARGKGGCGVERRVNPGWQPQHLTVLLLTLWRGGVSWEQTCRGHFSRGQSSVMSLVGHYSSNLDVSGLCKLLNSWSQVLGLTEKVWCEHMFLKDACI